MSTLILLHVRNDLLNTACLTCLCNICLIKLEERQHLYCCMLEMIFWMFLVVARSSCMHQIGDCFGVHKQTLPIWYLYFTQREMNRRASNLKCLQCCVWLQLCLVKVVFDMRCIFTLIGPKLRYILANKFS